MQAQTHDLGNLFVQRIPLQKGTPLFHRWPTNETEPPIRTAKSYIIRVPGTGFGLVFGRWKETDRDEDQALLDAIAGEWFDLDPSFLTDSNKSRVEALVSKYANTKEEREVFEDMLGLRNNEATTLPSYPQNYIWSQQGLQKTPEVKHP